MADSVITRIHVSIEYERNERVIRCTVQGIPTVSEMQSTTPAFWEHTRDVEGPLAVVLDVREASAVDFGIPQIRWVIAYRRSTREYLADRWVALAWVVRRDPLALRILLEIQSYDQMAKYTHAFHDVQAADAWCRGLLGEAPLLGENATR